MSAVVSRAEKPTSFDEVADVLRAADGRTVRARGGGTKYDWGAAVTDAGIEISTSGLARIVEHNSGDLTAIVEAGVPFGDAQAAFAAAGQMLALDPPLGNGGAATIGGVVATGDVGPLQHRYGAPRDLLLGITVALADGTIATSGGKVIKNVAGYDLAKLFAGSFGTLGIILRVVVRLHPLPRATATLIGSSEDPAAVAAAAARAAHAPLELESLDLFWENGGGRVLLRFGGVSAETQAAAFARALGESGVETEVRADDEDLWSGQRARQRSVEGVVLRVSGLPSELERVLRAADRLDASVIGRAGLGVSWIALPARNADDLAAAVEQVRRELAPAPCVVLDAPSDVRDRVDVWGPTDEALVQLMRRVKERFDPSGACAPGIFVGGI
ncbi:MAG: FAD-binding oxidoreductase [Actinobacteria bacterium]|nr:FAD-binding oxidoreductase [Actinomycetota bacterium]